MTRSRHDAHFAAYWVAQCARADRWRNNLAPDTGVTQPAERALTPEERRVRCDLVATGTLKPDKSSKYRNVRTDGYASAREAKRAAVLRLLRDTKVISNLREQVAYVLIPRQLAADGSVAERAVTYIADFVYLDNTTHQEVVEDCKGMRTREYIIKRKLMRFTHGIVVRET